MLQDDIPNPSRQWRYPALMYTVRLLKSMVTIGDVAIPFIPAIVVSNIIINDLDCCTATFNINIIQGFFVNVMT